MPIYKFRCPKCLEEKEMVLSISQRNDLMLHSCGTIMERLITAPYPPIVKVYGRDTVKDTLNSEDKYAKTDGKSVRSDRSQKALARGLDYERPLEEKVFTGF